MLVGLFYIMGILRNGGDRGPLTASYRAEMTQMTMGGSGVSEANGVLLNHYCPLGVI